ncbi:MAG: DUF5683 domain-containing protein [Candidatus Latescibacteria bacterium]|nr:DUF5683 domain-containing protein [Candidatus Latescibacterota bacterium]
MKPHAAVLAVASAIVVAMAAAPAPAGAADPAAVTVSAADTVAAAAPVPLAAREFRVAAPVSPTLATVMSPVFPGWGQLYADNGWRGVLAFGAEMFYWSRLLMYDRKAERLLDWRDATDNVAVQDFYWAQAEEYREMARDNAWWSAGALFIMALDAYVGAHLHRFEHDPVPVPSNWDPGDLPQPIELPATGLPSGTASLGWTATF